MIRSMTGYGRSELQNDSFRIAVEIKSVNNRYLDFNIRMPKKYASLDPKIRAFLKERIGRGKVDLFITETSESAGTGAVLYNEALARQYVEAYRNIAEEFQLPCDLTASMIAASPEVLTLGEVEEDAGELWDILAGSLEEAVDAFNRSRSEEGARLKKDLLKKLDSMEPMVDQVISHEPEIQEAYRQHLMESLKEILEDRDIDDAQIAAACVVYADKICTDEETVRLKSHIKQMKAELDKDESIGRKLDFLAQEMNREANTTLSKAGDLITSDLGIELKTMIEKLREQIQNIE